MWLSDISYTDRCYPWLFIWQPIILVLLDITPMMGVLDGVLMELQDCALPLLKGELGGVEEKRIL